MIGDATARALLNLERLWREMGLGYEDALEVTVPCEPLPIAAKLWRAHAASMERLVLGFLAGGEVDDGNA